MSDPLTQACTALIEKWREDAEHIAAEQDWCCAKTREHDADELDAVLASLVTPSEPLWTPKNPERTAEQQARDLLERLGWDEAQSLTAGDVCELANLIAECSRLRTQSVSPQPPEAEGKEAK